MLLVTVVSSVSCRVGGPETAAREDRPGTASCLPGIYTLRGRAKQNGSVIALTLRVLAPFLVVGILVLLLRWTWGKGHSLAQRAPRAGRPNDYGLLVPVAAPNDRSDAAAIGTRLDEAGIRYTLADTKDGMRVLVFEDDADRARALLR